MSLVGQTNIEGSPCTQQLIYVPRICHLLFDDSWYLCGGNVSALEESRLLILCCVGIRRRDVLSFSSDSTISLVYLWCFHRAVNLRWTDAAKRGMDCPCPSPVVPCWGCWDKDLPLQHCVATSPTRSHWSYYDVSVWLYHCYCSQSQGSVILFN